MPTYDYKCLACDVRFEKFQGITAPAIEECPECGGSSSSDKSEKKEKKTADTTSESKSKSTD